ncbi:MAG: AMMECR1 domain-containing protein [Armatimonadota bacterium]
MREAMEATLHARKYQLPCDIPSELLSRRAGAFVTLVSGGKLRACWGTLEPQQPHLAAEIVAAAQGVCSRDTRFPPLRAEDLNRLKVILTVVLTPPQPATEAQVLPREHGVLVRREGRSAVVLPHEGRTVRRMLALARQKAGIGAGELVEIYTFRVQTIGE